MCVYKRCVCVYVCVYLQLSVFSFVIDSDAFKVTHCVLLHNKKTRTHLGVNARLHVQMQVREPAVAQPDSRAASWTWRGETWKYVYVRFSHVLMILVFHSDMSSTGYLCDISYYQMLKQFLNVKKKGEKGHLFL